MGDSEKRKPGIILIIIIYCLVIYGNTARILQPYEPHANKIHSSLLIALSVFLIIGFWKRINFARIIAIVFHIIVQIKWFVESFSAFDGEFVEHMFDAGSIVYYILIFVMLLISIPNIMIIRYLVRDKGNFLTKKP